MITSILICGVGGQGIGLMGDVLCTTLSSAGHALMATETHGVAQRGGIVTTHIRFGPTVRSPQICDGEADYVFSLERLEGARFAARMLRHNGVLVYYDTVVQPQPTRASGMAYPSADDIDQFARERGILAKRIHLQGLPSPQMQNVALLGRIAALHTLSDVTPASVRTVLEKVLPARVRDINLSVFDQAVAFQPEKMPLQRERSFPIAAFSALPMPR